MTRYIEWGTVSNLPGGLHRETLQKVDPTDLATASALWSALPPDLRLALAKTAPKVAGKWEMDRPLGEHQRCSMLRPVAVIRRENSAWWWSVQGNRFKRSYDLDKAKAACDAALLAQGYVLDGEAP